MHVLVGYVIDGKSNGIDKYLLHVLDVMKQEDISFDFLTNPQDTRTGSNLWSLSCRCD